MSALCLLVLVAAWATCSVVVEAQGVPAIDYWSSSSPAPSEIWSPRYNYNSIIDTANRIYVIAGSVTSQGGVNDAWMTADLGNSWTCQTCLDANSTRFAPRYYAGAVTAGGFILVTSGYALSTNTDFNDVWISSDEAQHWSRLHDAPWAPQHHVMLAADPNDNVWAITDVGTAQQPNIWESSASSAYNVWQPRGVVTIGGNQRSGFGIVISANKQLFLAGGLDNAPTSYNDVWVTDLNALSANGTLTWTRLTANAPWSPRAAQLSVDSLNNLYVFGQFLQPGGRIPDLLWVSLTGGASPVGVEWLRVDNTSCNSVWPYPIVPDPGDFSTLMTSIDRLVIVSAGYAQSNPTKNTSTAFIQLHATEVTDTTNYMGGYQSWSPCVPPFKPAPKPENPGGGLSSGAKAAIVIVSLLSAVGVIAFVIWWRKRREFTTIDDSKFTNLQY